MSVIARRCIVVTGAAGFLGAAVARLASEAGTDVLAVTRPGADLRRLSGLSRVEHLNAESLADPKLRVAIAARKPEWFVHAAWRGVGGVDREAPWQVAENLRMTMESVYLAQIVGCRHWVGIGSQAEYGPAHGPTVETYLPSPNTFYGMAKLAACQASRGLCAAAGLRWTWLRLYAIYGPSDSPRWFIPHVISQLRLGAVARLTACEQLWDYLYVDDAARAVLRVLDTQTCGLYNLGAGRPVSLRWVAEKLKAMIQSNGQLEFGSIPYKADQLMHLEADIAKLVAHSGWKPEVGMEEGLLRTVRGGVH